jgi:hypothetical protein
MNRKQTWVLVAFGIVLSIAFSAFWWKEFAAGRLGKTTGSVEVSVLISLIKAAPELVDWFTSPLGIFTIIGTVVLWRRFKEPQSKRFTS